MMDTNTKIPYNKTNTEGKEEEEEEEYINMEVRRFSNSSSILFSRSTKEFEFQSSSSSSDRDNQTTPPYATSHADELFHMGKLLPLHFQTSRNFPQNPNHEETEERFHTPILFASTPIFNNTPFESCNVSPSESCHISRELNPDEYFRDSSYGNPWNEEKKTKKNKSSNILGYNKLKYWSYLKSLFTKSSAGCSDHRCLSASTKVSDDVIRPSPLSENDHHYVSKKGAVKNSTPFGQIKCSKIPSKDIIVEDPNKGKGGHRRSFSGAFKKLSKPKTSCRSSAGDHLNKRSISSYNASSEVENPIQAAIAHCKKSQKTMDGSLQ